MAPSIGTPAFWTAFIAVILFLLSIDLGVFHRRAHVVRFKEALVWSLLWVIYLSFVNVGQIFYAFGWESMLLEAGFFAIFLGCRDSPPLPARKVRPAAA